MAHLWRCIYFHRSCLETIGRCHLEQGQMVMFVQVWHDCIKWSLLISFRLPNSEITVQGQSTLIELLLNDRFIQHL